MKEWIARDRVGAGAPLDLSHFPKLTYAYRNIRLLTGSKA
jgi:hypothetical protein